MEEEKIKSLFEDFNPELSSEREFIAKLRRNLDSVEMIRRHTAEVRTRNRRGVAYAAVAGFIVGIMCTLWYPYILEQVMEWRLTLAKGSLMDLSSDYVSIIIWVVMGIASVITAINTYELSMVLSKPKP